MPELPEIETIKRGLVKFVLKKKIKVVEVLERKSFLGDEKILEGAEVVNLRRFGKALIIDLDNNYSMMIHLRMTGQLIFEQKGERFGGGHPDENFIRKLPSRQTRVVFEFENGRLYFNDQRKFGFVKVITTDEVEREGFIKKLGKEPWVMTNEELKEKLLKHGKAPIKAVLLDQTVMAGLGNIYVDETLFFAGVHPERRAGELDDEEMERILEGARTMMTKAIEAGGSTMANYVKADGTRGDYLEKFAQVFRREGKPCVRCGKIIKKIKVAGRGTHICEGCQRLEKEVK